MKTLDPQKKILLYDAKYNILAEPVTLNEEGHAITDSSPPCREVPEWCNCNHHH